MDKKILKREISLRFIVATQYLIHRYSMGSDAEFCKKIYLHPQVLSDIKTGKLNVGIDLISILLTTFDNLSSDWIFTGNGDLIKFRTNKQRDVINEFYNAIKDDPQLDKATISGILSDIFKNDENNVESNLLTDVAEPAIAYIDSKKDNAIPFVSINAIAGFGNANFSIGERDVKDYYVVPKFKDRKIDFMIEVSGSSMYPKYNSGDVVACRIIRESKFIQWNKVHVIATKEQGILIKRLKKSQEPNCLLAISDNKDYEPFDIPEVEIEGIAIVVGVVRLE